MSTAVESCWKEFGDIVKKHASDTTLLLFCDANGCICNVADFGIGSFAADVEDENVALI